MRSVAHAGIQDGAKTMKAGNVSSDTSGLVTESDDAIIRNFSVKSKPVVLVVEDEAAICMMLDLALRHYGFDVRVAATGQEAIEVYEEHHDEIALVLLDVQMPGMDGPATLAALKTINSDLNGCFMSGSTGKYSTEELLDFGAAHILVKPFASLSLLTRLLWDMIAPVHNVAEIEIAV